MPTSTQQAILREIWNNRFQIHSLRPLQSKIVGVHSEFDSVTKFHIEHRILPPPGLLNPPVEGSLIRRRELKFRPVEFRDLIKAKRINTLTINRHVPIEQAVIARLAQHGIILNEVMVEKIEGTKPLYLIRALKSPYVIAGTVKLPITFSDEDLLATDFLDGHYNQKTGRLTLAVTSYPGEVSNVYGSLVGWARRAKRLQITARGNCTLKLYSVVDADLSDYEEHLKLIAKPVIFEINMQENEQVVVEFNEGNTTLRSSRGEEIYSEAKSRIACLFTHQSMISNSIVVDMTSTEQV